MADDFFSIENAVTAAENAVARGRYADAVVHYRMLAAQTHVVDYEYDEWLRRLADVYARLGRRREAGWVQLYLHYFDLALTAFADPEHAADRGRALQLEKKWAAAGQAYLEAKRPVQAAVAFEEAGNPAMAAELWASLLSGRGGLRDRPYEKALAHFNLGMAVRKAGGEGAARHLVEAQRVLEQVADDFETRGERERAFDCYLILLQLGKQSGQFENLAEGYLNCIRVLREDGLKFYVLQFYEDFVKLSLAQGELHAAATLFREAADYSVRVGLPYHRHYLRRAAETWGRAAAQALAAGPPELAENAYLAAVECSSSIGDFTRVRETYATLATLELGEKKQKRYAAIAARYASAPQGNAPAPEFPEYLRQPHAYTDIWFVDLVEWEMDGDPEQVAASIVGDLRFPDGFRRRALNVILAMSDARHSGTGGRPETLSRIAEALGELQSYAALRPLEKLYESPDANVRRAAVRALRYLHFKRSFVLITRALADKEPAVREAGTAALANLHFPHAFHPLARIFRESSDAKVKTTALEAIGKIGSIESAELLLGVLRHEGDALRGVARKALLQLDNPDVVPIVRQIAEIEQNTEVRKILDEILARVRRR